MMEFLPQKPPETPDQALAQFLHRDRGRILSALITRVRDKKRPSLRSAKSNREVAAARANSMTATGTDIGGQGVSGNMQQPAKQAMPPCRKCMAGAAPQALRSVQLTLSVGHDFLHDEITKRRHTLGMAQFFGVCKENRHFA